MLYINIYGEEATVLLSYSDALDHIHDYGLEEDYDCTWFKDANGNLHEINLMDDLESEMQIVDEWQRHQKSLRGPQ